MTSVYEVYHARDENLPASTFGVPSEDDVAQTREVPGQRDGRTGA